MRHDGRRVGGACTGLLVGLLLTWVPGLGRAEPAQFPRPPQLEPDVRFWQRIYSKVTTQGGLMHDDRYLDELHLPARRIRMDEGRIVEQHVMGG